jgi:hypothetical protein
MEGAPTTYNATDLDVLARQQFAEDMLGPCLQTPLCLIIEGSVVLNAPETAGEEN